MLSPEDIQQLGSLPDAQRTKMQLSPGDDVEGSVWKNLINLRLQVQGNYVFWKTRGGSTVVNSFFGNVLTVYAMVANTTTGVKEYLAVHTAAGKVFLWDIDAASSNEIVSSGFSTTEQIQFTNIGRFLYMFDWDGGNAQYYDLVDAVLSSFLTYDKCYISAANFVHENMEGKDNLMGIEPGQRIIAFPNETSDEGAEVKTSADGDDFLDPSNYIANSFRYIYNGGKYLIDESGNEYKKTQFLTFADGADPFKYTVGGSGAEFTIEHIYIPLDETGEPDFTSYVTKVTSVTDAGGAIAGEKTYVGYNDQNGVSRNCTLGGTAAADYDNRALILPYNSDLEPLVGKPCSKQLSGDGESVIENGAYERPKVYRQYVCFDMLNDGSVTTPGLPYQAELGVAEILGTGASTIRLTVTTPSANVDKRFVATTRWQPTPARSFDPVSEDYSNSPLFISGEVDTNRTIVDNRFPDRKLFRGLTELQPLIAGVSDLFGSGSLQPNSVAQFTGSMMIAGYTVNRPTPTPYTNPAVETDGNIYVNITPTTQLANNMALAFMFEYADGRKSSIVETEEFLQAGSTVATQPVACDQTKASASHNVTAGVTYNGDITVTYEGITVTVPVTSASHGTAANVAEAIRAAVQGNASMRISAAVPSGAQIDYTEKRFGESFNGNVINVEQLAPFDVSGASYVRTLDINAQSADPDSLSFKPDGTKMYVLSRTGDQVDEYALSTPWDISTATYTDNLDVTAQDTDPDGIFFKPDGTKLWIVGDANNTVFEYDLGTAWDVSTAVYNSNSFSVATQTSSENSLSFKNDGTQMYVLSQADAEVYVYDLGTAWDVTSAVYNSVSFDLAVVDGSPDSIFFKNDGTKMWVIGDANDIVYEYDLGTAWDITSAVQNRSFDVSAQDTTPDGMFISPDGLRLYVAGQVNDSVYQYDLPADLGVTFDTEDPTLAGAAEPEAIPARAYIFVSQNNIGAGSPDESHRVYIDGTAVQQYTVGAGDSATQIHFKIQNSIDTDPAVNTEWDAYVDVVTIDGVSREVVVIEALDPGNTAYNNRPVTIDFTTEINVIYGLTAPGEKLFYNKQTVTAGANEGCIQATASVDVSANGLGGGATEDHTITVDGNATSPITIADTDTTEDIVDKYIAEIAATPLIDIEWAASKVDQGGGTWRLLLTYRQYGTIGNGLAVSVTGDTAVTVTDNSPSAGGDDGGTTPSGSASEVNANRLQIHSLNNLISKVFVLGRIDTGTKTFHLIDDYDITDAEAHGVVIDLPNTTDELDDIETEEFTQPASNEILESVELVNFMNIGTPFQEFQISTQEEIVDGSRIQRAIPIDFDTDKSTMRYRVMIFTNRNIQMGYLVDASAGDRRIFESDFEVVFAGKTATSRQGITDVNGNIFWESNDAVYAWAKSGNPQRIFNTRRYSISDGNDLVDVVYNEDYNEAWFIYQGADVVVFDFDSGATMRFRYGGVGTIRAGAFFGDKLYIATDTELYETDLSNVYADGAGDTVTGIAETGHVADELTQPRLLDITIGGQEFSAQVEVDLQRPRFEDDATAWVETFSADKDLGSKTLKMHGVTYQIQEMAVMPRIRITLPSVANGIVSHAILKVVPTQNIGKARM